MIRVAPPKALASARNEERFPISGEHNGALPDRLRAMPEVNVQTHMTDKRTVCGIACSNADRTEMAI